jgi:hypothetical protein
LAELSKFPAELFAESEGTAPDWAAKTEFVSWRYRSRYVFSAIFYQLRLYQVPGQWPMIRALHRPKHCFAATLTRRQVWMRA